MKEKIKKIIFGYLPGFITGIVICGGISVIAATYFPSNDVTYDNKESGLVSTDVQGAIDELYGVCTKEPTAGETIIENAGLEKDPYECRYFFTGANSNNYITFNDEKAGWRIISVECDGTIKIIKTYSMGAMIFDSSYSNWTRPASLNTYLNDTYYNSLNIETSFGSAILLSVVASVCACGASGVPGGSLMLIPLACGLFGIDNALAMQVVAVGFIIGVLQDSAETALNSSSDVLFTAAACLRAERVEQERDRREREINDQIRKP